MHRVVQHENSSLEGDKGGFVCFLLQSGLSHGAVDGSECCRVLRSLQCLCLFIIVKAA